MKIGIDLDEVICDYIEKFLDYYNLKNRREIKREDIKSYNLWENDFFGWDKEDAVKNVDEFNETDLLEEIELIEYSKEVIEKLKKIGEQFVITSRREDLRERNVRFLDKHFSDAFLKIIFTSEFDENNRKSKADISEELGIDFIIEDNKNFAKECAEKGIKVLLFDAPWNQNHEEHENIVRVKDWKEILNKIERIENG